MEFTREGCTFTIPDKITVRQQLEYFSAGAGLPLALRHWEGAKTLVQKWECAELPDYTVDLDSITDPKATTFIIWAGIQVMQFVNALDSIPKNS
jgi:hypothetical protein